jgi:hypothetical protein
VKRTCGKFVYDLDPFWACEPGESPFGVGLQFLFKRVMSAFPFSYGLGPQDDKCVRTLSPFNMVPCDDGNLEDTRVAGEF